MTTSVRSSQSQQQAEGNLAPLFRAVHRIWIEETTTYLKPLTRPGASFWARWTAVRYLADSFERQFRRERALLEQLRGFLPLTAAEHLTRHAERLSQLQQVLDRMGRRRGTALTVSVIARSLLEALETWCADLEFATRRVQREVLPDAAKDLIEDLEFSLQMAS
jgi:hypothetical protein